MYNYLELKPKLFTEEMQVKFLRVRDKVNRLIESSDEASMGEIINGITGSSWETMSCVDRLVEIGEIVEITDKNVMAQNRRFVKF